MATLIGKETKLVEFERENGVLRQDLERTKETLIGKETELLEFARKLKAKESNIWWMFGFLAILALAIYLGRSNN